MFLVILFVLLLIYLYGIRNHGYWAKRNVVHEKPLPFFGTHLKNIIGLKSITKVVQDIYFKYPNERVVGYFKGNTPELIVRDPDIIRNILNVDFASFYKRGLGRDPIKEPLLLSLFHVEGDKWKLLRQRLTPAFTTNKLKSMFPLVIRCAEKLHSVTDKLAIEEKEYDVRELMVRFTTEFIGACGFGIEMDTINNETSQFRELGKKMFETPLFTVILVGLSEIFPELDGFIQASNKEVERSMTEIFESIRKQRNYKPIGRNDFVDLLLELETKGTIKGESLERKNADGSSVEVQMELDVKSMVAQLFVFFAAGFETSSSATSFLLHQLAHNPDIQLKVQAEIDEVLSRFDNKLCFDALSEMKYLDMAFKESMRMFPSVGILNRVCCNKYTIPDSNITLDEGVKIVIPVQALQNDEKYFDNPSEFRPERFSPEEIQKRHKYVYLPFGEGPRICIGARLGQMQSLAGLAAVLHKFSFEPSENTRRILEVNPRSNVVQAVKHGVPLRIKRRKDKTN